MTRRYAGGELAGIVVDEYCGAILTATSGGPTTVSDIVDAFGMAPATAYRRIDKLLDCNLLRHQTKLDEEGDQFSVYLADFTSIQLEIVDGIAYLHVVREDGHEIARLWEYESATHD